MMVMMDLNLNDPHASIKDMIGNLNLYRIQIKQEDQSQYCSTRLGAFYTKQNKLDYTNKITCLCT